jgi:hypothetical protein
MKHSGIAAIAFSLALACCFAFQASAQSPADSSTGNPQGKPLSSDLSGSSYKTRPVAPVSVSPAFSINASASAKIDPLEYRSADEMTAEDHSLAANADARIREGATLAGMEFDRGKWTHQQLVCHALPDHVFLLFENDNGPGDLSLFSAAIPRGAGGRVRIIPIERRGYSLFSPASVNALTVAAFNRIRADEPANKSADWLATALCYAALAGARPAVTPLKKDPAGDDVSLAFPPTLELDNEGDSTVRFVDVASTRNPSEWALTFDAKGQLLKVEHFPTPAYSAVPLPQK